jgi:hypothetical protein
MSDNSMAQMGDDPMDRVSAANRLSLRAVLVSEGEDPTAALAAAGIVDSVAIPVVVAEDLDLFGGMLGDGRTPNLIAVLETEQDDEPQASAAPQPSSARPAASASQPPGPTTANLPAAFGTQPLAPVRTRRG